MVGHVVAVKQCNTCLQYHKLLILIVLIICMQHFLQCFSALLILKKYTMLTLSKSIYDVVISKLG